MRFSRKQLPRKSRFIKVRYEGVVELKKEISGIAPTSNLVLASVVLECGLNTVLPDDLKVVRVHSAHYTIGLDDGPKGKEPRVARRGSGTTRS